MNTRTKAAALCCFFSFQFSIATAQTLTVLHSFQGGTSDGANPRGELTLSPVASNVLLGSTWTGGQSDGGTVYSISLTSPYTETLEASFASGAHPADGPTYVPNVDFYGTTTQGGQSGVGQIFALSDPGNPVWSFKGTPGDGNAPYFSMVVLNGVLYGTTYYGGASTGCTTNASKGCGTLFSYDTVSGQEAIYSFCSQTSCADGSNPQAGLMIYKGLIYGTTKYGGSSDDGIVFSFNPTTGALKPIASFDGSDNGAQPQGTLIEYNDGLVGTAVSGGMNGQGTIFSAPPKPGKIVKMYDFCKETNCADGGQPRAGLVKDKRRLYGTANIGGNTGCNGKGCGTVFSFYPPSGMPYTVLHTFCAKQNCPDGSGPDSTLVIAGGKLYGTTYAGGTANLGTVFELAQ